MHVYVYTPSVSYVRIKNISASRVNYLMAITCVEFPFSTVEIAKEAKGIKIGALALIV